jgi:hypothetical protein
MASAWLFATPVNVPATMSGVKGPVELVMGPMKVLPPNVPETPVAEVWPLMAVWPLLSRTTNVPSGLIATSFL